MAEDSADFFSDFEVFSEDLGNETKAPIEADKYGTGEVNIFEDPFDFDQEAANEYSSSFSHNTYSISQAQNAFFSDPFIQRYSLSQTTSPLDINTMPIQRQFGYASTNRYRLNMAMPNQPINLRPINPMPASLSLRAMDVFCPRAKRGKITEPWVSATPAAARTDPIFNEIMQARTAMINPIQCGFIPSMFWPSKDYFLADIISDFFQRKNNVNCRFLHKLYNAVRLSQLNDFYAELVGVKFITEAVLKVNKGSLARLFGLKSVDGSLFHKQGSFPTYGFAEVNSDQAALYCPGADLSDVDFDQIKLVVHTTGVFTATCTEQDIYDYHQRKK